MLLTLDYGTIFYRNFGRSPQPTLLSFDCFSFSLQASLSSLVLLLLQNLYSAQIQASSSQLGDINYLFDRSA